MGALTMAAPTAAGAVVATLLDRRMIFAAIGGTIQAAALGAVIGGLGELAVPHDFAPGDSRGKNVGARALRGAASMGAWGAAAGAVLSIAGAFRPFPSPVLSALAGAALVGATCAVVGGSGGAVAGAVEHPRP